MARAIILALAISWLAADALASDEPAQKLNVTKETVYTARGGAGENQVAVAEAVEGPTEYQSPMATGSDWAATVIHDGRVLAVRGASWADGLKTWERELAEMPGFVGCRPVAVANRLLVLPWIGMGRHEPLSIDLAVAPHTGDHTDTWVPGGNELWAVDPTRGEVLWHLKLERWVQSLLPLSGLRPSVLAVGWGWLAMVDVESGRVLWQTETPNPGGRADYGWTPGLIVTSGWEAIVACDPESGEIKWTYSPEEGAGFIPENCQLTVNAEVVCGVAVAKSGERFVVVLDPGTGSLLRKVGAAGTDYHIAGVWDRNVVVKWGKKKREFAITFEDIDRQLTRYTLLHIPGRSDEPARYDEGED